ncbi:MAG: TonB-dependent receptor [Bacteroidales bacterium]|nr:TonB-dependent receptor [Bacteroidales bacterium]
MKKILFSTFLNMLIFSAVAQHRIRVLDSRTHDVLSFASVYFPDTKTGTMTDSSGIFTVNSDSRTLLTQVSCIGYKTLLQTLDTRRDTVLWLEASHFDLQEVVVSGSSSRLQGENVMNVERLNLINNPEQQGISLAEKLTLTPGVSNRSSGVGIGKPIIRGLGGNRIAVFAQGVKLENQQWGDEHGLGLDENGFEQVEIIKGPASLLYGGDALGGVLYFNDARFAADNRLDASLHSGFDANTLGLRNAATMKLSNNRLHTNIFGAYTTHTDYTDGNNNTVANSRFNTTNFKTALGYTGNKFNISLRYSMLREKYGLSDEDAYDISIDRRRTILAPCQDLTTHITSVETGLYLNKGSKLKIDAGYTFNNRKEYDMHGDLALNMSLETVSAGGRWYSPFWHKRWSLIAGWQGMSQTNRNHGDEQLIPDAETIDCGLFAVFEWHFGNNSCWQSGLRIDGQLLEADSDFEETYFSNSFSTGIYLQLSKQFSLRANLSSGFRAPNMFELLSEGVHEGAYRYETGNPDLKTENAYQYDISVRYTNEHVELFFNPYINYIKRFIYLQRSGSYKLGVPAYYYVQTDAGLWGSEAGFHFHPHPLDWLHLNGSYESVYGKSIDSQDRVRYLPLMPSHKLKITLRTAIARHFSLWLQNQYSFAQKRVAEYESATSDYDLVNAGISFSSKHISMSLSSSNIFNTAYMDHLSRFREMGIFNMGRNVKFQIELTL